MDLDAKAKKNTILKHFFKEIWKENRQRQNLRKNMLTNNYRSLHSATPIRFTMSSCKKKSITHAAAALSNLDAAITTRFAQTEFQNAIELRWITRKNVGKTTPELAVPLCGRSYHDPGLNERVPHPSAGQASPSIFRDMFCPAEHNISCIR